MDLINFTFNFPNFIFNIHFVVLILILIVILYNSGKLKSHLNNFFNFSRDLEISEKKLGIGSNSIKFKPNKKDKEIAYMLWVELSTRKLGIPLDMENDVIHEVYNSWYEFFKITRNLLKEFPVSKLKNKDSTVIIEITIAILNGNLRQHLTKYQAKYRHWYDLESKKASSETYPQDIQKDFPEYDELVKDLEIVNTTLIEYMKTLHEIVFDKEQ